MNSFLKESRKLLSLKKDLCIIIGNESCDLDSVVSSICYAFHLSRFSGICLKTNKNCAPLAVINIPRIELPLKTEVVYYLKYNHIELEHLVCSDEIDLDSSTIINLVLVDHHITKLNQHVINVIDHRPIDPISNFSSDCLVDIKQVGSNSTLIASKILETDCLNIEGYQDVMRLLYGAIILDTVNFSNDADRARPLDFSITEIIEKYLHITNISENRQQLFDKLVHARSDVSSLNSYQILLKDLKIISNHSKSEIVAIPGYPILVQEFICKEHAQENLKQFAEKYNSDVIVLIGMKISNKLVERDLGIVNIKNRNLFNDIVDELSSFTDLNLIEVNCNFLNGKFFKQGNIKMSRKQILPVIKNILDRL